MLNTIRYILLFCSLLLNIIIAEAQIAMPDSVCINSSKHYYVDPNPGYGSTYTWKINGVIQAGSISNEIDVTWNNAGTYLLEVQEISGNGCFGPLRSGIVIVSDAPEIYASSNSPVCEGSSINLTAQTVPEANYLWSGPNGYLSSSQNSLIPFATAADAGSYSLSVSIRGCNPEPFTVDILVNSCETELFIPDGFSPNSDGINDVFVIPKINNYPDNTIVIFNRWGNKVFEADPYQNTWNGNTANGASIGSDELPVGTYFYVLDLHDGSPVYKGNIYLNR
jgi:gliding motility-associated-like protein